VIVDQSGHSCSQKHFATLVLCLSERPRLLSDGDRSCPRTIRQKTRLTFVLSFCSFCRRSPRCCCARWDDAAFDCLCDQSHVLARHCCCASPPKRPGPLRPLLWRRMIHCWSEKKQVRPGLSSRVYYQQGLDSLFLENWSSLVVSWHDLAFLGLQSRRYYNEKAEHVFPASAAAAAGFVEREAVGH